MKCSVCHKDRKKSDFYNYPDEKSKRCKLCRRAYQKEYARRNRDKIRAYQREYSKPTPTLELRDAYDKSMDKVFR